MTPLQICDDLQTAYLLYTKLTSQNPPMKHALRSLETLESALRLHTPENICVAFNGGKDATVVLHLTLAAIAHHVYSCAPSATSGPLTKLNCLYLAGSPGENFEQVDTFVQQTVAATPALNCVTVPLGIRQGSAEFVKTRAGICAFVMGTRRTDPYSGTLERFEPSSPDWPSFMRVNPILDWTYNQIWNFLLTFEIPFCSMYSHGYTSIGSVNTTRPNPMLCQKVDSKETFQPAWMLEDEALERAGRS